MDTIDTIDIIDVNRVNIERSRKRSRGVSAEGKRPHCADSYCAIIDVPGECHGMTVLGIRVKNNVLLSIEFLDPLTHPPSYQTHLKPTYLTDIVKVNLRKKKESKKSKSEYVNEVVDQLDRYFRDPSWRFTINLETTIGSVFQQRVWRQLRKIPVGEKYTYGDIAKTLSSSPRAVGGACRSNPVPIIVPCHRVVSANGIGGFCGVTGEMSKELSIKRWLLQHELKPMS